MRPVYRLNTGGGAAKYGEIVVSAPTPILQGVHSSDSSPRRYLGLGHMD